MGNISTSCCDDHNVIVVENHEPSSLDFFWGKGVNYTFGNNNTPVDYNKACYYYHRAALMGHVKSMFNLGMMYGKQPDIIALDEAISYLNQASHNGNIDATYQLGLLYHTGKWKSSMIDPQKAIEYYEIAASQGQSQAMANLATIYSQGLGGIKKNLKLMNEWLEKAANANNIAAIFNIGYNYEFGINGVSISLQKASQRYNDGLQRYNSSFSILSSHDQWIYNMIKYRYGVVRLQLPNPDINKLNTLFESIDKEICPYRFMGLASLSTEPKQQIKYLIEAAEKGIGEAWLQLLSFHSTIELHQLWSAEKIGLLYEMSLTPLLFEIDPCETHSNCNQECMICKTSNSYNITIGVNRNSCKIFNSHLNIQTLQCIESADSNNGGFGEVRLGKLKSLSGNVITIAMKKALLTSSTNTTTISTTSADDLERELRYMQLLSPGKQYIVQCYGHTIIGHDHYIIMEASKYGDLSKVIRNKFVFNHLKTKHGFGLLLRWMYEIASGLEYMHRLFVRHGDIKPQNILVFDDLHVKLGDLGLSDLHSVNDTGAEKEEGSNSVNDTEAEKEEGSNSVNDTGAKSIKTCPYNGGTPGYNAPEILHRKGPSLQSDIFSYAVTWLTVINGGIHENNEFMVAFDKAKKLCSTKYNSKESEDMLKLLEKCLSEEREKRPKASECVEKIKNLKKNVVSCSTVSIQNLCLKLNVHCGPIC